MNNKISHLSDYLNACGFHTESQLIKNIFANEQQNQWFDVIATVDADYEDTAFLGAKKYMGAAIQQLKTASDGLNGITESELKSLVDSIPMSEITKMAKSNSLNIKQAHYKNANWWSALKSVGPNLVRYVVPYLSFVFMLFNLYYCGVELSKLHSELPAANLQWYDVFIPQKLLSAANQNKDNAQNLIYIAKATKSSLVLVGEMISAVANLIDGIKDVIMTLVNISSLGMSIALDIGFSIIIMIVEYCVKSDVSIVYNKTIKLIRDTAVENIRSQYYVEDNIDSDESSDLQSFEELDKLSYA